MAGRTRKIKTTCCNQKMLMLRKRRYGRVDRKEVKPTHKYSKIQQIPLQNVLLVPVREILWKEREESILKNEFPKTVFCVVKGLMVWDSHVDAVEVLQV